jgi:hypothetical protein
MSDNIHNPVERWLIVLSDYIGAELSKRSSGWIMKGTSDTWKRYLSNLATDEERPSLDRAETPSVRISNNPKSKKQWQDRLRLVEKSAAKVLTNAPVVFLAALPATKHRDTSSVLRLAFGYSLSLGKRVRRRFTAYFLSGRDESHFRRGDDSLLDDVVRIRPLDAEQATIRGALDGLRAAVLARISQEPTILPN